MITKPKKLNTLHLCMATLENIDADLLNLQRIDLDSLIARLSLDNPKNKYLKTLIGIRHLLDALADLFA